MANQKPLESNKRKFKRIKVTRDINIDIDISEDVFSLPMLEISKGGVRLKSDMMFTVGTPINLTLSSGENIRGKIRWVKNLPEGSRDYEIGVEFLTEVQSDLAVCLGDREFARKKPKVDIHVIISNLDDKVGTSKELVHVIDMSEGGLKIKGRRFLQKGKKLFIKISKDKNILGTVKWCSEGKDTDEYEFYSGIEFIKDKHIKDETLNVDYYNKQGIELRKNMKYEEALTHFRKALTLEPSNEILFYNLARVYINLKDKENTIKALRAAIRLDPGFTEAVSLLQNIDREASHD